MSLIENLKWRYATKKYDTTKKVSDEDLQIIKEAIQLTATSYGLQLYKAIIIKDQETRNKLVEASWGQKQVADASALIVLANYTSVTPENVDSYADRMSEVRGVPSEDLKGFTEFVKGSMANMSQEVQQIWTGKQTYIALGNILAACAELKIDSTPMEGFVAEKYNEILGLNDKGLNASVIIPIGYRADDDAYSALPKVRRKDEDFFIEI